MGANTYIGNAPNFMVKSISESSGIEMPSFLVTFLNGPFHSNALFIMSAGYSLDENYESNN